MGKKSGDGGYSHGGECEKDSRQLRKREEESRAHHIWYERTGPSVIIRNQLGGTRTSFEAEDVFDVTCDSVAHSINKGKRWDKVANAERILYEQNSSEKTSLVDASIPGYPCGILLWSDFRDLQGDVIGQKGGINKVVEVNEGEFSVRKAKSNRANLANLQSTAGPGPLLKKNRHRARIVKGKEENDEGAMSDPSDDTQHIRYASIAVKKRDPKAVERSWRCHSQADTVAIKSLQLFAFSCGHIACHSCWLAHAKRNARATNTAITCVNPECDLAGSVTEAAALFSDGTIGMFRDLWWDSLCDEEGSVPCYACARLLIPLKASYSAAALCPCGARTCLRCGFREHLPLSCTLYNRWATMCNREGIHDPKKPYVHNPSRHHTGLEKKDGKDCWRCGAAETLAWKNWCNACCHNLNIRYEDPVDSTEDLSRILEARARMMNGEYRQARIDRRLINKKKALAMESIVEDGVLLFELIAITRLVGVERTLGKKTDQMARAHLETIENSLNSVLFVAMGTHGDPEKNADDLKTTIDAIRQVYSLYM